MGLPVKYYNVAIYKNGRLHTTSDLGSFYKVLAIINMFDSLSNSLSKIHKEGRVEISINHVSSREYVTVHEFKVDSVEEFEKALMQVKNRI